MKVEDRFPSLKSEFICKESFKHASGCEVFIYSRKDGYPSAILCKLSYTFIHVDYVSYFSYLIYLLVHGSLRKNTNNQTIFSYISLYIKLNKISTSLEYHTFQGQMPGCRSSTSCKICIQICFRCISLFQ